MNLSLRRTLLLFAALTAMVFLVAACGSADPPSSRGPTDC